MQAKKVGNINDARAGLRKSRYGVTLTDKEGKKVKLSLGNISTKEKLVYAQGNIDDVVYQMGDSKLRKLERGLDLFKKQDPTSHMPSNVPTGFNGLPPEMQQQLMKAMKNKQSSY